MTISGQLRNRLKHQLELVELELKRIELLTPRAADDELTRLVKEALRLTHLAEDRLNFLLREQSLKESTDVNESGTGFQARKGNRQS